MTQGLAANVAARALVRLAETSGGFAVVIRKGDPAAGPILLQCLEKGEFSALFERVLTGPSGYQWCRSGPQDIENAEEVSSYLERRIARDPDLWVIELDIPDATQFIAELSRAA